MTLTEPTPGQLEKLLAPVSPAEFLRDYAGKRALLIPGSADKFADLGFDEEAFFAAAERFESDSGRLKAAPPAGNESEVYQPADPHELRQLYVSGLTVCCAGISDNDPVLAAFAESIRYALCVPDLRFNSYLSPDGRGFNLHYDAQPIFLMQMAGAKRWWYGAEAIVPTPRCYSSQWANKPELDALEQTVLEAGDVLYLPAFTWHRARARGFSLGLTLGVKGHHNQLLHDALQRTPLFEDWPLAGQMPLLKPETDGCGMPEPARAYLTAQLQALQREVSELTVDDLWMQWLDSVHLPKGPVADRVEAELFSHQRLRRIPGFPLHSSACSGARSQPALRLSFAGKHLIVDLGSQRLAEWIDHQQGPFSIADAVGGGGQTRAETKRFLREMLALGVLAVDDSVGHL